MSTPGSIASPPREPSPVPPSAIEHPVERFVDQPVRLGVLAAPDMADRPGVEPPQRPLHLVVEPLHPSVLDLVAAFDLAHDQLGVPDQLQLLGAVLGGELDPPQQSPVLGDVVRRLADPLTHFPQLLPVAVAEDDPDRRRAGVAPGAPVDVDAEAAHRFPAGSPARLSRPCSSTAAFHCRAAASSWLSSPPFSIWKTGRSSSAT